MNARPRPVRVAPIRERAHNGTTRQDIVKFQRQCEAVAERAESRQYWEPVMVDPKVDMKEFTKEASALLKA